MSSGGLVTGLSGLAKTTKFQWYGWPGLEVPENEKGPLIKQLQDEHGATPVFVDDELADRHYNGFSSMSSHPPSLAHYLTSTSDRLHPLAPLPLPPWRDHIR
jgi:trehalose 6-phosphate synthase